MSCGVGRRCGSDLILLWLWCRPAAAAPIQPLAWELPYATCVALESKKKKQANYYFYLKGKNKIIYIVICLHINKRHTFQKNHDVGKF